MNTYFKTPLKGDARIVLIVCIGEEESEGKSFEEIANLYMKQDKLSNEQTGEKRPIKELVLFTTPYLKRHTCKARDSKLTDAEAIEKAEAMHTDWKTKNANVLKGLENHFGTRLRYLTDNDLRTKVEFKDNYERIAPLAAKKYVKDPAVISLAKVFTDHDSKKTANYNVKEATKHNIQYALEQTVHLPLFDLAGYDYVNIFKRFNHAMENALKVFGKKVVDANGQPTGDRQMVCIPIVQEDPNSKNVKALKQGRVIEERQEVKQQESSTPTSSYGMVSATMKKINGNRTIPHQPGVRESRPTYQSSPSSSPPLLSYSPLVGTRKLSSKTPSPPKILAPGLAKQTESQSPAVIQINTNGFYEPIFPYKVSDIQLHYPDQYDTMIDYNARISDKKDQLRLTQRRASPESITMEVLAGLVDQTTGSPDSSREGSLNDASSMAVVCEEEDRSPSPTSTNSVTV